MVFNSFRVHSRPWLSFIMLFRWRTIEGADKFSEIQALNVQSLALSRALESRINMARQIHLLSDAFEKTFDSCECRIDQCMSRNFANYATNRGYACAALLFKDLGMQLGQPEIIRSRCDDFDDSPRKDEIIRQYWEGNNCSGWFTSRSIIHDGSFGAPVKLLTLMENVPTLLGELQQGGVLVACQGRDRASFPWAGLQKWFLSDKSTLLFKCTDAFCRRNKTPKKLDISIGDFVLCHGDMAVLYLPPETDENRGMSFKQWISTPDFMSAMTHQCVVDRGYPTGFFVCDYQDMKMQPEFVIQGTLSTSCKACRQFHLILDRAWHLWNKLYPGNCKAEAITHGRIAANAYKMLPYRISLPRVIRAVLIIQRMWKQRFYHPCRYVEKLEEMIKSFRSDNFDVFSARVHDDSGRVPM